MATLPISDFGRTGLRLDGSATSASAGGDQWLNTGIEMFIVENDGPPLNITFETGVSVDMLPVEDRTISISNNEVWIIGPFPPPWYNDVDGFVKVTYDNVTGVRVKVVRTLGLRRA